MSVGPRAKAFNIVSNDHGRIHKCDFSVFDRNNSFWANIINGDVHFFRFWLEVEISFLCKLGPKNQNCYFKLKSGTYINSNMQNSMVIFTFFYSRQEFPILGKFGPKQQNCQFKLTLLSGLIRIWKIRWWCSRFLF